MKCPGELYEPSERKYEGMLDLEYPMHDRTIRVTNCGRICMDRRKINFSRVFAGHDVGVRQVDGLIFELWSSPKNDDTFIVRFG